MDARRGSLAESSTSREIVVSRVFGAPRELLWRVWTDPARVVNWWGPNGFSTTIEKMDLRPGGVWKHVMHGPDGTDYPNVSVFQEIVEPERIVFKHGGGKKGGPGAHFTATWTFEALGAKSRLTVRMVFETLEERDLVAREYGAVEGAQQTLERLAGYLAKPAAATDAPVLVVKRHFDHPVEAVFDAWLDPAGVGRWLFATPTGVTRRVEIDARVGGKFIIAEQRGEGIAEHLGTYELIERPRRLVFSFADSWNSRPTRVSVVIEPAGHGCELTLTHEFDAQWAAISDQARAGWTGVLDGLARTLAAARAAGSGRAA
jgi:uncharacterized protein YndB with AHSA1/START domain